MPNCLLKERPVSACKSWNLALILAFTAAALAGCGGGGGGSGSGSSGGGIDTSGQLVVSPTQINVTALTTDVAPTAGFQVVVQESSGVSTPTKFFIDGTETHNGIDSVSSAVSGSVDQVTVSFKTPASLGVGTYNDTITIKGCDDQACTRQVTGSPTTISVVYTVTLVQPQIFSISPASATAGAAAFMLTVSGNNFTPQSVVQWNGTALPTTVVSANQLTAQVSAANLSVGGNYTVTVSNGTGAVSSGANFTVTPLAPLTLTTLSPSQVSAGGANFILTAIGTGFASTSSIAMNGTNLTTTYVSSTMLRAPVTAAQIATVGTAAITVVGGGTSGTSAPLNLTIAAPSVDAVAYQMNAAHTGGVTFKTIALPTGSAWSVDVGGTASYALIAGGQIYVTVAINGNSELVALNGTTGVTVWGPLAFPGTVNAAYDRGRIFVVSGSPQSQIISAFDASTGNSQWSATVPGDWFPEPPVAAGGIVYTTNGGFVAAFDETTGATLWQNGVGGTSGIVAVTVDGVYGASPCTAVSLQPAVGTILWSNNSGCSGGGGATPAVANGFDYAPNNSAGSSGTTFDAETGAVKGSYSANVIPAFSSSTGFFLSNGTLQGLAVPNNLVLWSFAGDGQLVTSPIVVNNYVFIGSSSGNLYALDASSGHQVWTQNLGAAIPSTNEFQLTQYTGLAAGDGLLIVPNGTKVTAYVLSTSP